MVFCERHKIVYSHERYEYCPLCEIDLDTPLEIFRKDMDNVVDKLEKYREDFECFRKLSENFVMVKMQLREAKDELEQYKKDHDDESFRKEADKFLDENPRIRELAKL